MYRDGPLTLVSLPPVPRGREDVPDPAPETGEGCHVVTGKWHGKPLSKLRDALQSNDQRYSVTRRPGQIFRSAAASRQCYTLPHKCYWVSVNQFPIPDYMLDY